MVAGLQVSSAREEILGRVRRALVDVPEGEHPDDVPAARGYRRHSPEPAAELIRRFAERVRDLRPDVRIVSADDLCAEVSGLCGQLGLSDTIPAFGGEIGQAIPC